MIKTKALIGAALALLFLLNFSLAKLIDNEGKEIQEPSKQGVEQTKGTLPVSPTKETEAQVQVSNPAPTSFILVTDVIDGFGGQKQNGGCDRYLFAGGQSSAIGTGTSNSYKLNAGFVNSTVIKCGDANADGGVTVSDVVYLVNFLFKGGPVAKPYEAGEANCDGRVTISDVVYLVNYLFKGGPPPIC